MRAVSFRKDPGLSARMGGVSLGLGALYVLFGVVLMQWMGSAVLGFAVVLVMAWGQWFFSDTLALRSMRAKVVTAQQAPELHAMIDRLCLQAGLPKPKVAIAQTDVPNAFATGRSPSRSAVCVTTGILQRLTADELEGVLAHELAHVANRDVSVMTVASSLGLLAGFVTQWGFLLGGGRNRNNGGPAFIVVWLVSMVVYFLSFILTRSLSRYRELSADRRGAYLTGDPRQLATALQKISGDMTRLTPAQVEQTQGASAFFFAPALSRQSFSALFSTHPPLEQRLAQLAQIEVEMRNPGAS
ncbi:zinc metalloprotease HtpX [Aeromicrobium sp. IC_218]|uniref:zinc metalloprotease HtpX n=1 Tax=Aeromicrobium sp. IC_218 TaxID=2545468 RepID=UPI00103D30C6|nr:zinc metalloprotease HtpX [Aeromicrobium sp. IC_218]TCI99716.1 zinc metalloprotease HtpX [Aeromicrobium sp. IC_218]